MANIGYVKVFRKLLEWEWFTDGNTLKLFMYLLLIVNRLPSNWLGVEVNAGQKIITYRKICNETGLTMRELRTCLNRLKSTHEITLETTHHYSLITITNWASYQSGIDETTQQLTQETTNQRQTNDKPTTNQRHIYKNDKKKENEKNVYGEFGKAKLTGVEYQKLIDKFGEVGAKERIDKLDSYVASTGKKYDSHYATILAWERKNEPTTKPVEKRDSLSDLLNKYPPSKQTI